MGGDLGTSLPRAVMGGKKGHWEESPGHRALSHPTAWGPCCLVARLGLGVALAWTRQGLFISQDQGFGPDFCWLQSLGKGLWWEPLACRLPQAWGQA